MVKVAGYEICFGADRELAWLEMQFRTEDNFYTVKHGETTYKCWEGKWIGAGTLGILGKNLIDATLLTPGPMDSLDDSEDV